MVDYSRVRILGLLLLGSLIVACTPVETGTVVEITSSDFQPTPQVIYVTPTREPTLIPTFAIASETPIPSATPSPSPTMDRARQVSQCTADLTQLYTIATEFCVGEPSGFFCNGGLAPRTEPPGPVNSAMAVQGSLVEVDVVDAVQTAPLLTNNGGGVLWLRVADTLNWTGLLLGDVTVRDATIANSNFPAWQALQIQTNPVVGTCDAVPENSMVIQSAYGEIAQVVVNGVSIVLRGTLHLHTVDNTTHFTMLEGLSQMLIFGQGVEVYAGQRVDVVYAEGDFSRPIEPVLQNQVQPLIFGEVENFPITLLDRPVLLPQPGFVTVDGRVNMRSDPSENARILFLLNEGEPLSVLGQNAAENWYHVRLGNGETGWIRNDLVTGLVDVQAQYDATPLPPQRFGEESPSALVVTRGGGNLRRGPDTGFGIISTLPEGTDVTLLERSPYSAWVKVQAGGQTGWMALITLETNAIISFLPQDFDAPLPPRPTATPNLGFGGGHAYPNPGGGQ